MEVERFSSTEFDLIIYLKDVYIDVFQYVEFLVTIQSMLRIL